MTHPFDLSGRVAVITGGNGGLGLGMATTLVQMGCAVSIWGRDAAKNDAALAALSGLGGPVEAHICDVADQSAIDAAMDATLTRFGRVDGMFANAGIGGGGVSFMDRTPEDWARMLDINVMGVVRCFQVAGRHMVARAKAGDPFGRLVVTSSVAAIMGAATAEHYGASKAAVMAITRALAVEMARHGVTVNAIQPGYAASEMTEGLMANERFVKAVLPRVPMRRFGQPNDYGAIAGYLMSDGSGYHTGQGFVID
ncbi:MAG: NAD(P)-dependent dehydrogenase (short-subunit alcohol dehydrogenase family), partial [Paracoccaceae bacterium]